MLAPKTDQAGVSRLPQTTRISVIITTHNRKNLLRQAIESVLNQEPCGAEVELLIVDDNSTDDTAGVIAEYQDAKYLHSRHGCAAGARNVGIAQATGTWIAFLDDDDVWLPQKLKTFASVLEKEPDARVIFSAAYICDHLLQPGPLWPGPQRLASDQVYDSFLSDVITPSVVMLHHEVFAAVGLFDTLAYRAEDRDLWVRIARAGFRFVAVPEPLVLYRGRERLDADLIQTTFRANLKILQREFALKHRARPAWLRRRRITLELRGWYTDLMLQAARQQQGDGQISEARRLYRLAFAISPPHWLRRQLGRWKK
jgi:glycosyltransferase involved in cell wall biosynthesis